MSFLFLNYSLLKLFKKSTCYGNYTFAYYSIPSILIKFLTTAELYSTHYILAISSFIWSYSMCVCLKGLCRVILGCAKERRKFTFGNSLLRVQTLTSIFGIAAIFIDTVTLFCFQWLGIKTWFMPSRRCIYCIEKEVTRCQLTSILFHILVERSLLEEVY